MHNPRIGRRSLSSLRIEGFFSVNPLAPKYPHNSPYAFSKNRVIDGVELEGLEVSPAGKQRIYDNLSAYNVNMSLTPSGRKKGGRIWNPKWNFEQIDELFPDFWSSENKVLISNKKPPKIDKHFLNIALEGLDAADTQEALKHISIGSDIHHHHWVHGHFAGPMPQKIHTSKGSKGWTGLIHKFGKTVDIIAGVATMYYLMKGDIENTFDSISPIPNYKELGFNFNTISLDFLRNGLINQDLDQVIIGLGGLNSSFRFEAWTKENLIDSFLGEEIISDYGGGNKVNKSRLKSFDYLRIYQEDKFVGSVTIPKS